MGLGLNGSARSNIREAVRQRSPEVDARVSSQHDDVLESAPMNPSQLHQARAVEYR